MNQLEKIEDRVLSVLESNTQSRSDDMVLYLLVCNSYSNNENPIGKMPFEVVMKHYRELKLPHFESVRRIRQKIQAKEVFFMFSGEKVLVDLRCDNSLMKTMVDRFGEDVTTLAYDMTSFRVQTEVSASPTFFGWVFGFNGKVQILAPESVKEQYRQMIAQADEGMQQKENKRIVN